MSKKLQILEDVKKEITYDSNGEGYISQRGIARLVGVDHKTVSRHIKKQCPTLKVNGNNQIHEGSLLPLLRSVGLNSPQVLDIVEQIETIGVRTVFHGCATTTQRPMTQLEAFELMVKQEKERLVMLEKITIQGVQIDDDAILTNKSDEYYPVSHVKALNQGMVISPIKLGKKSLELNLPVKQLYSNYETTVSNTYHTGVWIALYPKVKL